MRLVLVEWIDSGQPVAAWQWLEGLPEPKGHRCQTVGHLLRENDHALMIALSVATVDSGEEWGQAAGIAAIPKCSVRRIVELTVSSSA